MFGYEDKGFFDTSGYAPRVNPHQAYFMPPVPVPVSPPVRRMPNNSQMSAPSLESMVPPMSFQNAEMPVVPGIEPAYLRPSPYMQPMIVREVDLSQPPQAQYAAQQRATAPPSPSVNQMIDRLAAQHAAAARAGAAYGAAYYPAPPQAVSAPARRKSAAQEPVNSYTNRDIEVMKARDAQRVSPQRSGRTVTGKPMPVSNEVPYTPLPDRVNNSKFFGSATAPAKKNQAPAPAPAAAPAKKSQAPAPAPAAAPSRKSQVFAPVIQAFDPVSRTFNQVFAPISQAFAPVGRAFNQAFSASPQVKTQRNISTPSTLKPPAKITAAKKVSKP